MRGRAHAVLTCAATGLAVGALCLTGSHGPLRVDGPVRASASADVAAVAVADCASAVMSDLDVAAESAQWADVPAPRWDWLESACEHVGTPDVAPGVFGSITVYEDMSYTIIGYGDTYNGCAVGGLCEN